MLAQPLANPNYDFAAEPRVVQAKSKYRELTQEEDELEQKNVYNLMWDRRVVRGNTYASIVTTTREAAEEYRARQIKPRRLVQRTNENAEGAEIEGEVGTPRAVDGRRHVELVTDENVESLTDKPPVYEKDAQTDFVIERIIPRHRMPVKIGEDRETQIWDGELWNFDHEVEPLLQVLIGKALEQGRMEVLEEEELRILRAEQRKYDELRLAEDIEAQELEAKERKRMEENERNKKQHKLKLESMVKSHQKLVSRAFAKEYLRNIRFHSKGILKEQGVFVQDLEVDLNGHFLPWIFKETVHFLGEDNSAGNLIIGTADIIIQELREFHEKAIADEKERVRLYNERTAAELAEKNRIKAEKEAARKARKEQKRRDALTDQISETLMAKADTREKVFGQNLSDLDSYGKEGLNVGLVGGIIGELLILFSTLEQLKEEQLSYLQNVNITEELISDFLTKFVFEQLEGMLEIGVASDLESKITPLEEGITLDTLFNFPAKANEITEILKKSIKSHVLNWMKKNLNDLQLKDHILHWSIGAIIKVILNPDESARKIKFVTALLQYKNKENPILVAITSFVPSTEGANLYQLPIQQPQVLDTKASKNKLDTRESKNSGGATNKASGAKLPGIIEPEEPVIIDPADVDYDDKVTVFPVVNEEIRVFVSHKPAQIVLRRQFLLYLGEVYKDLMPRVLELLKKVNSKAIEIEERLAKTYAENFAILPFDMQ